MNRKSNKNQESDNLFLIGVVIFIALFVSGAWIIFLVLLCICGVTFYILKSNQKIQEELQLTEIVKQVDDFFKGFLKNRNKYDSSVNHGINKKNNIYNKVRNTLSHSDEKGIIDALIQEYKYTDELGSSYTGKVGEEVFSKYNVVNPKEKRKLLQRAEFQYKKIKSSLSMLSQSRGNHYNKAKKEVLPNNEDSSYIASFPSIFDDYESVLDMIDNDEKDREDIT